MKKGIEILLVGLMMLAAVSCTEEYIIEVEEGERLIGVAASFTDELKRHEAILSYTSDFYNSIDDIQMVTGATVYVTDGLDTVYYLEDPAQPGHYFTAPVAGRKKTLYRLCVDVMEEDGEITHLFAESYMGDNVDHVDSLVIKPYNGLNDTIPIVLFGDTLELVYPYFQSLEDTTIIYMPMISKNDTLQTDTLDQRMVVPMGGYAGYYVNGPEMQAENKEIPIHYFRKPDLRDGDVIRADLYSIQYDYLYFYYSLMMSTGSNPMMGAPANVVTNIQPEGKAAGWFTVASVVSVETVFEDN